MTKVHQSPPKILKILQSFSLIPHKVTEVRQPYTLSNINNTNSIPNKYHPRNMIPLRLTVVYFLISNKPSQRLYQFPIVYCQIHLDRKKYGRTCI